MRIYKTYLTKPTEYLNLITPQTHKLYQSIRNETRIVIAG